MVIFQKLDHDLIVLKDQGIQENEKVVRIIVGKIIEIIIPNIDHQVQKTSIGLRMINN